MFEWFYCDEMSFAASGILMPSSLMALIIFARVSGLMYAISVDTAERAAQARLEWQLVRLVIAYGLSTDQARAWGLYLSNSIKDTEPPLFSEPGLFLIQRDTTLYCASIQTMPFARPAFRHSEGRRLRAGEVLPRAWGRVSLEVTAQRSPRGVRRSCAMRRDLRCQKVGRRD